MKQFTVHTSRVKLFTKKIVNTIRIYFLDLWSTLTKNKDCEQQSVDHSNSKRSNKISALNRIKSMKKTRRMSNYTQFKPCKHVQKVIKNDSCLKRKSHRISKWIF